MTGLHSIVHDSENGKNRVRCAGVRERIHWVFRIETWLEHATPKDAESDSNVPHDVRRLSPNCCNGD